MIDIKQQRKINYKNSVINYYKYGSGEKVLFCLHGYGESGISFSFLESYLGNQYTLYAIDLPFHGNTLWKEKEPMLASDLAIIFKTINPNPDKKFSMLAYSFGGRIAMYFFQDFFKQVEHIALVAPDGLHVNFWYWLSAHTSLGNKLFKACMQNPKIFFSLLNIADKTNLINKSIVKFVHCFLDDANERLLLYKRWTAMKTFNPNLSLIKRLCTVNNATMRILSGRYDRIILSKHLSVFSNTKNIKITTVDAGHRMLNETNVSAIINLLAN